MIIHDMLAIDDNLYCNQTECNLLQLFAENNIDECLLVSHPWKHFQPRFVTSNYNITFPYKTMHVTRNTIIPKQLVYTPHELHYYEIKCA